MNIYYQIRLQLSIFFDEDGIIITSKVDNCMVMFSKFQIWQVYPGVFNIDISIKKKKIEHLFWKTVILFIDEG